MTQNTIWFMRRKNRLIRYIFLKLSTNNLTKWTPKLAVLGHVLINIRGSFVIQNTGFLSNNLSLHHDLFPTVRKFLCQTGGHRIFLVGCHCFTHYVDVYLQRPVFQRCVDFEKGIGIPLTEPTLTTQHRKKLFFTHILMYMKYLGVCWSTMRVIWQNRFFAGLMLIFSFSFRKA